MATLKEFFDAVINRITFGVKWKESELRLADELAELRRALSQRETEIEELTAESTEKTILIRALDKACAKQHREIMSIHQVLRTAVNDASVVMEEFRVAASYRGSGKAMPNWVTDLEVFKDAQKERENRSVGYAGSVSGSLGPVHLTQKAGEALMDHLKLEPGRLEPGPSPAKYDFTPGAKFGF